MTGEMLGAFAALVFVLALLGIFAWIMRRFGLVPGAPRLGRGNKEIKILESQTVDVRNRLVVVRWRGRDYLLACGTNGVSLIGQEAGAFDKLLETSKDQPGEDAPSR